MSNQPMTNRFTIELERLQRDSHDLCMKCAHFFKEGETAHAGYAEDGSPLYVGNCCASNLKETAARFCWMKRVYELPEDDSILWRYMDFAKFVLMLKEKSMYFPRADCLGDRFEGAKGVNINKSVWDDFYIRQCREMIENPPLGSTCTLTPEEVQKEAEKLAQEISDIGQRDSLTNFVSCWHENGTESEALWRLYCPPPSFGVAIRTNYQTLNECLGNDPSIKIGRVQYIDFRKRFSTINDAIFYKRHSLSHEKEVRAVIKGSHIKGSRNIDMKGIDESVNLEELIHEVVVSPFASEWFKDVLIETMRKFGITTRVSDSEILLEPFF